MTVHTLANIAQRSEGSADTAITTAKPGSGFVGPAFRAAVL